MNEASSTNHCRNLINKLYQSSPLYLFESEEGRGGGIVENSSENEEIIISSLPHTDMIEAVENCWRDIIKQYWLQAKGPKVEVIIYIYIFFFVFILVPMFIIFIQSFQIEN